MFTRTLLTLQAPLTRNLVTHQHAPLLRTLTTTSVNTNTKPEKKLRPDQLAKKLARDERRRRWIAKTDRIERNKTRRVGRANGVKQAAFRAWWDKRRDYMSIMDDKATKEGLEWKIKVAALVARPPVVTPDQEDWEIEWWKLKTYLSSYRKVYPPPFGPGEEDSAPPKVMDIETLLPEGLRPLPRITPDDESGNVKTRNRKLPERVFLTVRGYHYSNGREYWTLPTTSLKKNEPLLNAATRVVRRTVGKDLKVWELTNCPHACEVKVYEGEEKEREVGYFGEKMFFMMLQWTEGDVNDEKCKVNDYAWLTREEMVERVREERGEDKAKFFHYML